MWGNHEFSLIQFEHKIPSIIYELFEITEKKPLPILEKYIYLGSEEELKKRAYEQEKNG